VVGAVAVGVVGHWLARRTRRPVLPFLIPSIAPLLPGSILYRGLIEITQGTAVSGLLSLVEAVTVGLALGAGVNLGGELMVAFQVRVCAAGRRPAVPAAVTGPLWPELVSTKEVVLFYVGPPVAPTPPCSAVPCTVSSDERARVRRCSHDGHETPPTCDASHY